MHTLSNDSTTNAFMTYLLAAINLSIQHETLNIIAWFGLWSIAKVKDCGQSVQSKINSCRYVSGKIADIMKHKDSLIECLRCEMSLPQMLTACCTIRHVAGFSLV